MHNSRYELTALWKIGLKLGLHTSMASAQVSQGINYAFAILARETIF